MTAHQIVSLTDKVKAGGLRLEAKTLLAKRLGLVEDEEHRKMFLDNIESQKYFSGT